MGRQRLEKRLLNLVLLAFALSAAFSAVFFARLDLTISRANTLSQVSKQFYRELDEPVRITYFISASLKAKHPGPQMVEDFLRELEAVSRGKIYVRFIDPSKDPSEAEALGIKAQQMQVVEKSERRLALVYSGIAVEYLDKSFSLPAVVSPDTLEYELLKGIRALISGNTSIAGILVGDNDKNFADDYKYLQSYLAKGGYELREIPKGQEVDADISVLFVIGNSALERYDAYWIDRYIMGGGKVFFAVKGVDVNANYNLLASKVQDAGIPDLLASYGIIIKKELVLDASSITVPFQQPAADGTYAIRYIPYPHWIIIDTANNSIKHVLTGRFSGLDLYWPSPLEFLPVPGETITPLFKTSPKAWKQTKVFYTAPDESDSYALEQEDTRGSFILGLALEGSLRSAFQIAEDLPSREGGKSASLAPQSSVDTRCVVISGSDSFSDLVEMMQSGTNMEFAVSAADWLTQREDLLSIRTRNFQPQRLDRIKDGDAKNSLIVFVYILNIAVIPAVLAVTGLLVFKRRRDKEKKARL